MSHKTEHAKHPSHTKSGPGRYHKEGGVEKTLKQKKAGAHAAGLTAWRTAKPSKGRC